MDDWKQPSCLDDGRKRAPETCSNMQVDRQPSEPLYCDTHHTEGHFQAERQTVNMNSCKYCGKCFQTPYFLDMHQQVGCDMLVDDSEDEDSSAWIELVNASYLEHDDLYGEKVDALLEEEVSQPGIEVKVLQKPDEAVQTILEANAWFEHQWSPQGNHEDGELVYGI